MKRLVLCAITLALATTIALAGCGKKSTTPTDATQPAKTPAEVMKEKPAAAGAAGIAEGKVLAAKGGAAKKAPGR